MSINIIHIDDEQDVATYLDELCQKNDQDVFIHWFETFDDGIEALKEKPFFYNGLILDAKCLLNKDDGVFDEQNVIKTINEVETIFRTERVRLPYCILSGYKERLQRYIETHGLEAFDKNAEEDDAIDYIIRSQSSVLRFKFTSSFPAIIEMAQNGMLLNHNISTIIQLYQAEQLLVSNGAIIKAQISQVRPILERMLIHLSNLGEYDGENLIPEEYTSRVGGSIAVQNLPGCFMYLSGKEITVKDDQNRSTSKHRNKVMPDYISRQASNIYAISSEIANHTNNETGTKHTLSMVFYSLMDILHWYKGFVSKIS